ncbi:venom metalloproteinase inhibitor DM43-like isoform 2-T2 [Phoenicopterus ruber ruber]
MIVYCLVVLLTSSLLSSQCPSLVAFLQLLPLAVFSADPLPAPTLYTDPKYDVYYEGESVTLKCKAPEKKNLGGFRFFHQTEEYPRLPTSLIATFEFTATKASAESYTCMYFVNNSGQEIPSSRSLPLSVQVQDAPRAPTLSLDPQQQVYTSGNSIKLLCSIPNGSSPNDLTEVQYYADFGHAVSLPLLNMTDYSYNLRLTGEKDSGSYSCAYFVTKSGRPVRSERSPLINIDVKSRKISWIREVIVGGSFFTINGLIFFFSHHLMKRREGQE